MSWESVQDYLKQYGADGRMIAFSVSSATVELAAQALNVEPARIAKTLTFRHQGGCVVVVFAGDARVDNSLFKAFFHEKAAMPQGFPERDRHSPPQIQDRFSGRRNAFFSH